MIIMKVDQKDGSCYIYFFLDELIETINQLILQFRPLNHFKSLKNYFLFHLNRKFYLRWK